MNYRNSLTQKTKKIFRFVKSAFYYAKGSILMMDINDSPRSNTVVCSVLCARTNPLYYMQRNYLNNGEEKEDIDMDFVLGQLNSEQGDNPYTCFMCQAAIPKLTSETFKTISIFLPDLRLFLHVRFMMCSAGACRENAEVIKAATLCLVHEDAMKGQNLDSATSSGCYVCGQQLKEMFACSRCERPRYCSQRCQKLHWKSHRQLCKGRPREN